MNIKDKIREAFREDMDNKASQWNPDTQPNLFELDRFLRKSGYRLVDVLTGAGVKELMIEPKNSSHLYPEITHDVSDNHFYINVKRYGELIVSDVEEVIKGYQNAVSVVKRLEQVNLDKLEVSGGSTEEESEDGR